MFDVRGTTTATTTTASSTTSAPTINDRPDRFVWPPRQRLMTTFRRDAPKQRPSAWHFFTQNERNAPPLYQKANRPFRSLEITLAIHANGSSLWRTVKEDPQFVLSHANGWEGAQQTKMRRAAVMVASFQIQTPARLEFDSSQTSIAGKDSLVSISV